MIAPSDGGQRPKSPWLGAKFDFRWLRRTISWKTGLLALTLIGCAAAFFIVVGGVDISADAPDGPLATHGLHFVFKRSVSSASKRVTPPADLASPTRVRLGAQHFDMVCANCHGRPGFGQSVVALSMSPRPQYLPNVIGQFTDAELYIIVEHGVKYSAMPSWATDVRGDEVWSMVAFLRQLPKLDAKAYHDMTATAAIASAPAGSGGDAALQPANARRNTEPVNEFLYAAPTAGFADPSMPGNPATTCARCHGPDGSGAATGGEAPNLTLQNADYLKAALQAYVSGARKSGFMQTIAAQLSRGQIAALADYYANLPIQTASAMPSDPILLKRGELIATQGLRDSATPACGTCHESQGGKIIAAPHIAGQSETYIRRQLTVMRGSGRGASVMWNPMPAVAHNLADTDIAALAAYYASLKPTKATGAVPVQRSQRGVPAQDLAAAQGIFADRCMKCHVNNGRGDVEGNYPNLTIQTEGYAAQSLYAFHSGARPNGKMKELVDTLSLDQLTSLARYVGGLTPLPAVTRPDAAAAQRGAAIATGGVRDRGIPACLSCHGANAIAALPLVPALQGQNVAYLRRKLDTFAAPYPGNDYALNPMPPIARRLKDQERADLAAYFAAAPPLQKALARP